MAGVKLKVHRNILAARSPVFKTMLAVHMKERTTGRVEITDIEPTAMGKLVEYLYTGECSGAEDMACELLADADKYKVMELKSHLQSIILNNLSVDNVVQWEKKNLLTNLQVY